VAAEYATRCLPEHPKRSVHCAHMAVGVMVNRLLTCRVDALNGARRSGLVVGLRCPMRQVIPDPHASYNALVRNVSCFVSLS